MQVRPECTSDSTRNQTSQAPEIKQIKHVALGGAATAFEHIVSDGLPVILKGLDIGPCVERWTLGYVSEQLGEDRKVGDHVWPRNGDARSSMTDKKPPFYLQVVVHESSVKNMDFNAKNFRYTTMAFGDFARGVQAGNRMYLRALSPDAPADQAASLERDFPALATEFSLPKELVKCADNVHSSVLRVSGPVNMWLHYGASLTL